MPAFTLASPASHEEEIRKSRFLARAASVDDPKAALAFLRDAARVPASHHAWAYRIGNAYRFNDDGEPGGTAGKPIMQAIEGQQCDHVIVVVTRWFGGIELGTGGLVRAYGGCAAACLRNAELTPLVAMATAQCRCTFAELPLIKARLIELQARVDGEAFDAQGALLTMRIPVERFDAATDLVLNITRGRGMLTRIGE